jgi:hypothetical protein
MAVLKAAEVPCLTNANLDLLHECLSSVATAVWNSKIDSPSLKVLEQTLNKRLLEAKHQVYGLGQTL